MLLGGVILTVGLNLHIPLQSPAMPAIAPAVTTWRMQEGLPLDTVRALMQTRDHYLWIATLNGLARFDGTRFVLFEAANTPNLPNNLVTALHEDDQGNLWLGLETGDIARWQQGEFTLLPKVPQWPRASVERFVADGPGKFYALSQWGAVLEITNSSPGFLIRPNPEQRVLNLIRDHDGRIWAQRRDGFAVLDKGRIVPTSEAPPVENPPIIAFTARAGGIWILDKTRLRRWRAGRWVEDRGPSPPLHSEVPIAQECSTGQILAGSFRQGLYVSQTNGSIDRIGTEHGLESDWINCVMEDHEGGWWVGTSGGGISRIQPAAVAQLPVATNIPPCSLLSVSAGLDDAVWFGSEGEGVLRYQNGIWSDWSEDSGLDHPTIRSILCDRAGTIWAGTWGGGLRQMVSNRFELARGWTRHLDDVTCIYQDAQGDLYAGTRVGLMQLQSNAWNFVQHKGENLFGDIRCIAVDQRGGLWVGTAGDGLWHLGEERTLKRYSHANGLRTDNVWAIAPDRQDPGVVWVGTQGNGLVRVRHGDLFSFTSAQGFPANTVSGMVEDEAGKLWLATYEGIVCVDKKDLNRVADERGESLPARLFDFSDGLTTLNFSAGRQPTVARTSDGRIWFVTTQGAAVLKPEIANARRRTLPPSVQLEKVVANDSVVINPAAKPPLTLGPGLQRLEIYYGAVSFTSPKRIHFRYRLRGLEESWVHAETRRNVNYSHLPPGNYTFEVKASNSDGEWGDHHMSFALVVKPTFWQRRSVQFTSLGAATLLMVGSTYGITRARQRRKLAALKQQHALERERARIAHDIHDDLGANLTRISMLSDIAQADSNVPPDTATMVGQIAACARTSVNALDEIVWAVNPRHDTLDALLDYVSHYCHSFLEETNISLQLALPAQQPALPVTSETRYGILMVLKEALNNVVKHSSASTVRVAIRFDGRKLQLEVQDNGRGTRVSESPLTGDGLASMRERAAKLGGYLTMEAAESRGTGVRLVIPLPLPTTTFK
jgi:signal transduction histidine kinase/ligand-binding sensor domain-containing protein